MLYNPFFFVLAILAIVFSVPLLGIWTEHRRKLAEMRLRAAAAPSEQLSAKLLGLHKEIADLRATATEYDLSLDTALETLGQRVDHMEERLRRIETRYQSAGRSEEDLTQSVQS